MRLLLDANLVVLLIVGTEDPGWIVSHKRTNAYSSAQFELLTKVLSSFNELVTIPHVLAEASNLLCHGGDEKQRRVMARLGRYIETTTEIATLSRPAAAQETFLRIGLTDTLIELLLMEEHANVEVLTVDGPLHVELVGRGLRSTNFNHLIEQNMM